MIDTFCRCSRFGVYVSILLCLSCYINLVLLRCLYIKAIDNWENIEVHFVEQKVLDFASDKLGRFPEEIAGSHYETRG